MSSTKVRRALISVSDKLGVADFARALNDAGVEIYSTGGTRRYLEQAGIPVVDIAAYTGFPEVLEGRVKTLHPKIFGGILFRRDVEEDLETIEEHGILSFEIVAVNLYPFEATVARDDVTRDEAVENIDIGGPSLIRAAAKNHAFVAVATHPEQYSAILEEVQATGEISEELRRRLMVEAFSHTAEYDRAIADHFGQEANSGTLPRTLSLNLKKKAELRHGENPHQSASLYSLPNVRRASLMTARQLNGKELSFNNYLDLDAALSAVRLFEQPGCAVLKHTNPCGAAIGETLADATRRAFEGDPVSAFGSVIGMNRTVDEETAQFLCTPGLFVEAIVAPDYSAAAMGMLTTVPKWKNNVRIMQVGRLDGETGGRQYRHIDGGMLVQDLDDAPDLHATWKTVTQTAPSAELLDELRFAWLTVRMLKSNAISVTRDRMLIGAGAGQMSRVDSVEIALKKAGEKARGAVLASDAFFPFPDSIERAAEAGIAAIVQPGGSVKDADVIAACDERGIAMLFTGRRHFKH